MSPTPAATPARPTWADYWATVGNEDWLAARELAEISPRVRGEAERFLCWEEQHYYVPGDDDEPTGVRQAAHLDWDAYAAAVEADGSLSSGEWRLAKVVAALTGPDSTVDLCRTLGNLGSWEAEVWAILIRWATGGRLSVVAAR